MLSEHPPETPEDAAKRAAERSSTLGDFRSQLEYERRNISSDDADTRDELGRAGRRFDRAAVGHRGQQLTDDIRRVDRPGNSPHVERSDAASVFEQRGEFALGEAADRADSRSRQERVQRLVDPKTGRIYTPEELNDGALTAEMNKAYRGQNVFRQDATYAERTGAQFVETYSGVDAFRDFVEGAEDALSRQTTIVRESNIDTSDQKRLAKLADRAGFGIKEKQQFMQEFAPKDDEDPMEPSFAEASEGREIDPFAEESDTDVFEGDDFARI